MLKFRIVSIGKDKDQWVTDSCAHFSKMLRRWAQIEWIMLPSLKNTSSLSPSQIRKQEASFLAKEFERGYTLALSDKGQGFDSLSFAAMIRNLGDTGNSSMTFVIGGAHGIDPELLEKADRTISLSPLTFSHQLVRAVLAEQLYRACSIIAGTDYHK